MSHVLEVINPATEECLAEVPVTTRAGLDAVVSVAQQAQSSWAATAPSERRDALLAFADVIESHAGELHRAESDNVGKIRAQSDWEPAVAASAVRYYAGWIDKLTGDTLSVDGGLHLSLPTPVGVAGLIVPWNYPMLIAAWKLAPALATGNAAILKPSDLTPLSALVLERLAVEAGLPEHLVSVVNGGADIGSAVVEHPGIGAISFTGSTPVGRLVGAAAGAGIKRVALELGGRNVSVVTADADIAAAAAAAPAAAFENAGQDCCARSRVFVHRSRLDEFVTAATTAAAGVTCGRPDDDSAYFGAVISAGRREELSNLIAGCPDVAWSGPVPDGAGFWVAPTIVVDTDPESALVNEEIFGPVLVVQPFDALDALVPELNRSPYGLAASVWAGDASVAMGTAARLDAGTISINSNRVIRTETPFGGVKQSGVGKDLGRAGLDTYMDWKSVFVPM